MSLKKKFILVIERKIWYSIAGKLLWRCGGTGRRESIKLVMSVTEAAISFFDSQYQCRFNSCHRLYGSGFSGFWKTGVVMFVTKAAISLQFEPARPVCGACSKFGLRKNLGHHGKNMKFFVALTAKSEVESEGDHIFLNMAGGSNPSF